MEEVWKGINLSSLDTEITSTPLLSPQHHHHPRTTTHPSSAGILLLDFLAGSFKEGPPPPPPPPPPHSSNPYHLPIDLNLESSSCHLDPNSHVISSIPQFGFCSGKRHGEQQTSDGFCGNDGSCDDRRQKRMIKNRESAARSRARKQAYTNELELKVSYLGQENAKLRKQCDELRSAMAAQIPVKKTPQKASSSPF